MVQTVTEIIYEAFWENLSQKENVRPETIKSLKDLYKASQIANKTRLAQLVQEMEEHYAKDQKADS